MVSAVSGSLLRAVMEVVTRGAKRGRSKALTASAVLPFACLLWAGMVFAFQGFISESVLHRDPGIGKTWHLELPNGYTLLMVGTTDHGWVYSQARPDEDPAQRHDTIAGVRSLQVAGRYVLGGANGKTADHEGSNQVDSFFLLDTEAGKHMTFTRYEALSFQARQLGIEPNLEPISIAYSRLRFSWFDVLTALLLLLPPCAAIFYFGKWIVKIRASRPVVQPARPELVRKAPVKVLGNR